MVVLLHVPCAARSDYCWSFSSGCLPGHPATRFATISNTITSQSQKCLKIIGQDWQQSIICRRAMAVPRPRQHHVARLYTPWSQVLLWCREKVSLNCLANDSTHRLIDAALAAKMNLHEVNACCSTWLHLARAWSSSGPRLQSPLCFFSRFAIFYTGVFTILYAESAFLQARLECVILQYTDHDCKGKKALGSTG